MIFLQKNLMWSRLQGIKSRFGFSTFHFLKFCLSIWTQKSCYARCTPSMICRKIADTGRTDGRGRTSIFKRLLDKKTWGFCVEDVWSTSIWRGSCVLIWKKIWYLFVFTLCIWVQLRQISIFCWYLAWNFFLFSHQKFESGHDSYLWKHVLDFRLFRFLIFCLSIWTQKSRNACCTPCMIYQKIRTRVRTYIIMDGRTYGHLFLNVCQQ